MAVQFAEGRVMHERQSWLRRPILALDRWLRRRTGITEYTGHPDCVFRMQIDRLDREVTLSDGARGSPGDRVVMLHLWNEQVPVFPANGATIGWARRLNNGFELSLRELAAFLASRPDLDDIALVGMTMNVATAAKTPQLLRIMDRYGFEPVPFPPPRSFADKLHQLGSNVLVSLITLAQNPASLRPDSLKRVRGQVFMSRDSLRRRYAGKADHPGSRSTAA